MKFNLSGRALKISIAVILGLFPLCTVLAIEYLQRESFIKTVCWVYEFRNAFIVNYLILLLLLCGIFGLSGRFYPALALFASSTLLSAFINAGKLKILGDNFFPWDIFIFKQLIDLFPRICQSADILHLVFLPLMVFAIFSLKWIVPVPQLQLQARVFLTVTSFLLLAGVVQYRITFPFNKIMQYLNVQIAITNQYENYRNNGFVLAFLMNFESVLSIKPANYTKTNVLTSVEDVKLKLGIARVDKQKGISGLRPDIIVIMNESFWDPMTIGTSLLFSQDPIPTFRKLSERYTSGWLLSPVFGGVTCNAEFEFLTGFNMSFYRHGAIPYLNYINQPINALPAQLKKNGYRSVAIHPYTKSFWNREAVYDRMGFDEFISQEQFHGPEIKGYFIADAEVSRSLIRYTSEHEGPLFLFAISMQNHMPYLENRYGRNVKSEFIAQAGNMTEKNKKSFEVYLQGLKDADDSLRQLIEHYSQSNRPTMIVFLGDHLPALGEHSSFYREAGFISSSSSDHSRWSLDDQKKMKSVPVLIWTNFNQKKQELHSLSFSFLSTVILRLANFELSSFHQYIENLSKKVPGLTSKIVVDAKGGLRNDAPPELESEIEIYRLLQYDLLMGAQYSQSGLFDL